MEHILCLVVFKHVPTRVKYNTAEGSLAADISFPASYHCQPSLGVSMHHAPLHSSQQPEQPEHVRQDAEQTLPLIGDTVTPSSSKAQSSYDGSKAKASISIIINEPLDPIPSKATVSHPAQLIHHMFSSRRPTYMTLHCLGTGNSNFPSHRRAASRLAGQQCLLTSMTNHQCAQEGTTQGVADTPTSTAE